MEKIAIISAILEDPVAVQREFNEVVASYKAMVCGRVGIPFNGEGISVISLVVRGSLDDINALNGRLGRIPSVSVKTAVSKKTF